MNEFKTTSDLVVRDLDGIYLRANIDGKWDNRCLTDLVWEDVENWLKWKMERQQPEERPEFLLKAIKHLHGRLRAVGDQLNIATGHGAQIE
jgi:hypothetical protein